MSLYYVILNSMASASAGADANQGDEPAAGHRHERRGTT
jgi:hypothetical protein